MITKRVEFQSQKLKNFQTKHHIFRAKYGEKKNQGKNRILEPKMGGGELTKMEIEKNGLKWVNNVQKMGLIQAKNLLKFQKNG